MSQGTYKSKYSAISLFDRFECLSKPMKRKIEKGFFGEFYRQILPLLIENEPLFAPLYSANPQSRPSEPTYLVLGYLVLKDQFNWTDEELEQQVQCNVEVQYALGTTSFERQFIHHNTLNRFRAANAAYEMKTGICLIAQFTDNIANSLRELHVTGPNRKRRMDSVMVRSGCKKMNRIELVHTCITNALQVLDEHEIELPADLKHYLEDFDRNKVVYHDKTAPAEKLSTLGSDAVRALKLFPESLQDCEDYLLLKRVISEQLVLDEDGQFQAVKDGKELNSKVLQNPSDPDATFRTKAGQNHVGYVGNFVETVDLDNGHKIIDSADLKQNTYSDSDFAKDEIHKMADEGNTDDLVTDGAYGSDENIELAKQYGINLLPTDLTGKSTPDLFSEFTIDQESGTVHCPNGLCPDRCSYNSKSENYHVSYLAERCAECPFAKECPLKMRKHVRNGNVSEKAIRRAEVQRTIGSEEYKANYRFRNGVEAIPSQLRRKQKIDDIPVKGLVRKKFWFLMDVTAINIRRAIRYGLETLSDDQFSLLIEKVLQYFVRIGLLFTSMLIAENYSSARRLRSVNI